MRTARQLAEVSEKAEALREARGDTLWTSWERDLVERAFDALAELEVEPEETS